MGPPLVQASQSVDTAAMDYMPTVDEFFAAAGLDESQASSPTVVHKDKTGHSVSQRHLNQLGLYEAEAISLTRALATSELTMYTWCRW